MTINELIEEYREAADKVLSRLNKLKAEYKHLESFTMLKEYRKRIEVLHDEYEDLKYAISLMQPYRENTSDVFTKASGEN